MCGGTINIVMILQAIVTHGRLRAQGYQDGAVLLESGNAPSNKTLMNVKAKKQIPQATGEVERVVKLVHVGVIISFVWSVFVSVSVL